MLRRAYSLLEIRSVDAEQRILTGIATSASTDSYGDVVEPDGAEYTLPIPLLWQHNSGQPIGEVYAAKNTAEGIEIKARIAKVDEPGNLKDRLDEAWQTLKAGLVKGLSIGFRPLEETYDKVSGGFHFLRWQWVELSAVTIPANTDATIQTIRVASGAPRNPAGASASTRTVTVRQERPMKKSYADQIVNFQNTRAAKVAKQDAIMEKSAEAGTTLDAAEKEEHDTLALEIKELDEHLDRLAEAEKREKAAAARVTPGADAGIQPRAAHTVTVERRLPPGIAFARYAMCMGMARGNEFEARELARRNYGDYAPELIKMIEFSSMDPVQRAALQQRTAVGAAATSVSGWASELVPYTIMDDFITFLRPGTILGKFGTTMNGTTYPKLRGVPFNTRVTGFSAGLTANWVGEGLPATLSKATSYTTSLTWSKLAALAVLTKEEIRFSNPSAEAKVRDDLAAAMVAKQDKDFIDPSKAASANVSPSSITYQTAPVLTTGTTAAALRTDLATLIATFATLNMSPDDIVLIMNTIDALNISLMITSLGNPVFPGLTMQGGNLLGFPVITTTQCTSIGSPVSNIIVAVKASEIYLADDGVVTVDASDQASVEMVDSSSQSGVSGTGASLVSFWQSGLLGLKATREINWKLRRTGAARYIYNSAYKA
jgi:HK97 family phage major capsid protein/HK97 family phage prohead protease